MAACQRISAALQKLATAPDDPTCQLSPQMTRKLGQLIACWQQEPANIKELFVKILALYDRLLLELVQAHYSTRQREQDLIRLVESKGCFIRDPELVDQVIELLIQPYRAAEQRSYISFQRQTLIRYILSQLNVSQGNKKRQIERVIQTIYRCKCFHIVPQEGASSHLSLKFNLYDALELRTQVDTEIIEMAQAKRIRLSPHSWAYLLHGRSSPANIARVQPILERTQTPVYVDELEAAIEESNDRLGLKRYCLRHLYEIQDQIEEIRVLHLPRLATTPPMTVTPTIAPAAFMRAQKRCNDLIGDILERLANFKFLFAARQHRAQPARVDQVEDLGRGENQ